MVNVERSVNKAPLVKKAARVKDLLSICNAISEFSNCFSNVGDKGDKGDLGEKGVKGFIGPQGIVGEQGIQGPIGNQVKYLLNYHR